jgi:DNA-binding response OmpR family regulator
MFEAGVDDYLTKPVSPTMLADHPEKMALLKE